MRWDKDKQNVSNHQVRAIMTIPIDSIQFNSFAAHTHEIAMQIILLNLSQAFPLDNAYEPFQCCKSGAIMFHW